MSDPRPMSELSESGLLWLINRAVFHPRGFALTLVGDAWTVMGNGTEPWSFPEEVDKDKFVAAEQTLWEYREGSS